VELVLELAKVTGFSRFNSTLLKAFSQTLEPIEDRAIAPGRAALFTHGFDLGKGCAFHLQVNGGVLVRSVQVA
jgi:hypothetical protein